jgi:hypothetical protein
MAKLKKTRWYLGARHITEHAAWLVKKGNKPASHLYKQQTIKKFAKQFGLKNLVETGTYLGEMVYAMRGKFENIYSVELSRELFLNARNYFWRFPQIKIYEGDSAQILPLIVRELKGPSLFWLDGHYSGGVTARGELQTPVIKELGAIIGHAPEPFVILIDDARCFVGKGDYPSLEEIRKFVTGLNPALRMLVENDVIRIF